MDLLKGIVQYTPGSQAVRDTIQNVKDVGLANKVKRVEAPNFTTQQLSAMGNSKNFYNNPQVASFLGNLSKSNTANTQLQSELQNPTANASFNKLFGVSPIEQQRQAGSQLYGITPEKPRGTFISPTAGRDYIEGISMVLGGLGGKALAGTTGFGGVASRAATQGLSSAGQSYGESNPQNALASTLIGGGLGTVLSVGSDLLGSMKGLKKTGTKLQAYNTGQTEAGMTTKEMSNTLKDNARILGLKKTSQLPNSAQGLMDLAKNKSVPLIELRQNILDTIPETEVPNITKSALQKIEDLIDASGMAESLRGSEAYNNIINAVTKSKSASSLQKYASTYGKDAFMKGVDMASDTARNMYKIGNSAIVSSLGEAVPNSASNVLIGAAIKKNPLLGEYLGKAGTPLKATQTLLADTMAIGGDKAVEDMAVAGLTPANIPVLNRMLPTQQEPLQKLGSVTGKLFQGLGKTAGDIEPVARGLITPTSVGVPQLFTNPVVSSEQASQGVQNNQGLGAGQQSSNADFLNMVKNSLSGTSSIGVSSENAQKAQLIDALVLSGQLSTAQANYMKDSLGIVSAEQTASQQIAEGKKKVVLSSLTKLKDTLDSGGTGILALQDIPAQGGNSLAQKYKLYGKNIWDSIARNRTGAAINKAEEEFYKTFIPDMWDTAENRTAKLDELASILSNGDVEDYLGIKDIK